MIQLSGILYLTSFFIPIGLNEINASQIRITTLSALTCTDIIRTALILDGPYSYSEANGGTIKWNKIQNSGKNSLVYYIISGDRFHAR